MATIHIDLSDIEIRIGDYIVALTHVGHVNPYKWRVTPHSHTLFELHCVTVGHGILSTPETEYEMTPGTICLTGPGLSHSQYCEADDAMDEYCLRFKIEPAPPKGSGNPESELIEAILDTPFFISRADPGFEGLIRTMIDEGRDQSPGFRSMLTSKLGEFIVLLGRFCRENRGSSSGSEQRTRTHYSIGGVDLKSSLDTYFFTYEHPAPVEMILDELHITRRHFSRLMQKYYGMSYKEKINELRISYAKQLLSSETETIAGIAALTGFASTKQLTHAFRQATGMTPREYRQLKRGKG